MFNQGSRRVDFPQGLVPGQNDLVVQGQQTSMGLDGESLDLQGVQWLMPKQNLHGTASVPALRCGCCVDRCPVDALSDNDGWSLGVRELQINDVGSFAQAKGAVLRIKSLIGLFAAYAVSMGGKQSAGWQMPSGGVSSRDGAELRSLPLGGISSVGCDHNAAHCQSAGVGVDGQIRYNNQSQRAAVDLSYLASDDLYNGLFDRETYKALGGEAVLGRFDAADRWAVSVDQEGSLGPLTTQVDLRGDAVRDPVPVGLANLTP